MTYEEMIKLASKSKSCKKLANDEHKIQCACVKWFRLEYPKLKNMLFAIPNAARRSARNGAYMKDEGMLPGVADLILLKSNRLYGALCVEMKSRENTKDRYKENGKRNVRQMVTSTWLSGRLTSLLMS